MELDAPVIFHLEKRCAKFKKKILGAKQNLEREARCLKLRAKWVAQVVNASTPKEAKQRLTRLIELERGCFRKLKHSSRKVALATIQDRKFNGKTYFCGACYGWHIADKRKKKKKAGDVAEPGRLQRIANP